MCIRDSLRTVQGNQTGQQATGVMAHAVKKLVTISCRPRTRVRFSTRSHDHGPAAHQPTRLQTDRPALGPSIDTLDPSRVEGIDTISHEQQPESLDNVLRLVRHREHSTPPLCLQVQPGFGKKSDKVIGEKRLESGVEEPAGRAEGLDKFIQWTYVGHVSPALARDGQLLAQYPIPLEDED